MGRVKPPDLCCLRCGGRLTETGEAVLCAACGMRWPVRNGIPVFSVDFPYWGEIDRARMIALNRRAGETGWRKAVAEIAPQLESYVGDSGRAAWSVVVPWNRGGAVLDLGAGLGGNAFPLSTEAGSIEALEAVYERAEFMDIRRRQEGAANLRVVAASVHDIPYPPNSFDLVVMNGMLEWAAIAVSGNPREAQKAVLKRNHDLLKSGGWIYIGIENRFGVDAFIGVRDHSGLRFTSLMPRRVADIYCRLRRGRSYRSETNRGGYRTYTYGFRGYRRLLEESGFTDIRIRGALSYNEPKIIYDLHTAAGFKLFLREAVPRSSKGRLFRRIALTGLNAAALRFFSPSFLIAARKS
jgi:SAM-dependent methyltransferase